MGRARARKPGAWGKEKTYQFEMTSLSLFLWSLGFFFLLAWIFVLGILVGRGFLPSAVTDIADLKGQIHKLQEMIGRERAEEVEPEGKPDARQLKLAFYERLSSKKDEARSREREQPSPPPAKKKVDAPLPKRVLEPDPPGIQFTLQVASLEDRRKAEEMVQRLMAQGYPAYFYEVEVKGKTFYRVRCGRFPNREDASRYGARMRKESGIDGFVSRLE